MISLSLSLSLSLSHFSLSLSLSFFPSFSNYLPPFLLPPLLSMFSL